VKAVIYPLDQREKIIENKAEATEEFKMVKHLKQYMLGRWKLSARTWNEKKNGKKERVEIRVFEDGDLAPLMVLRINSKGLVHRIS